MSVWGHLFCQEGDSFRGLLSLRRHASRPLGAVWPALTFSQYPRGLVCSGCMLSFGSSQVISHSSQAVTTSLPWEFMFMYYVGERESLGMRDRAENPTVGVGAVHRALAAPHTPLAAACFFGNNFRSALFTCSKLGRQGGNSRLCLA